MTRNQDSANAWVARQKQALGLLADPITEIAEDTPEETKSSTTSSPSHAQEPIPPGPTTRLGPEIFAAYKKYWRKHDKTHANWDHLLQIALECTKGNQDLALRVIGAEKGQHKGRLRDLLISRGVTAKQLEALHDVRGNHDGSITQMIRNFGYKLSPVIYEELPFYQLLIALDDMDRHDMVHIPVITEAYNKKAVPTPIARTSTAFFPQVTSAPSAPTTTSTVQQSAEETPPAPTPTPPPPPRRALPPRSVDKALIAEAKRLLDSAYPPDETDAEAQNFRREELSWLSRLEGHPLTPPQKQEVEARIKEYKSLVEPTSEIKHI